MPSRLERQRQKLAQEQAKLRQLEAVERTKERKRENRRCLLYGRAILAAVRAGRFSQEELETFAEAYIVKKNERIFLGLEVESQSEAKLKLKDSSELDIDNEPEIETSSKKRVNAWQARTEEFLKDDEFV